MNAEVLKGDSRSHDKRGLVALYFDLIYNPLYDLTVARTAAYKRLQTACLNKVSLNDGDRVLCIGVGTGNEVAHILRKNNKVDVTGVDGSDRALGRAFLKARRQGREMTALKCDVQQLELPENSFDKVICLHVMGFLPDDRQASQELFRVLKKGGQFVVTYPSGAGSSGLAAESLRSMGRNLRRGRILSALSEGLALVGAGLLYAPLSPAVKPREGFYTVGSLEDMLSSFGLNLWNVQEDAVYQDFIVYGVR